MDGYKRSQSQVSSVTLLEKVQFSLDLFSGSRSCLLVAQRHLDFHLIY